MRNININTKHPVAQVDKGTLYIIATPIGNLEDVSLRSLRIMGHVDILACEDTRHTGILLKRHGVHRKAALFAYHEHNEHRAAGSLIASLNQGKNIGLVSNAGFPGISDPGYRVVNEARNQGITVEIIPGPDAVTTALIASGLPSSSYTFKGFSPRKTGQRKKFIEMEKNLPHTLVFFESPYRIGVFLADAHTVLGNRLAAVCVELTKKFERVHRDFLDSLSEDFAGKKVKGEITVVIAGNNPKFVNDEDAEE